MHQLEQSQLSAKSDNLLLHQSEQTQINQYGQSQTLHEPDQSLLQSQINQSQTLHEPDQTLLPISDRSQTEESQLSLEADQSPLSVESDQSLLPISDRSQTEETQLSLEANQSLLPISDRPHTEESQLSSLNIEQTEQIEFRSVVVDPVPIDELVCKRCLKQCKNVAELVRHLNSKTCIPIDENHDLDKDNLIAILRKLENKRYACKYCNQIFSHSPNKIVHEKICHVQKKLKMQQIDQPKIVTIFNEDLSVIPNAIIDLHITNSGANFDIVGLVKHIHFNPEYPTFQNIRKQNKKMGTLSVYQDGTWVEKTCESIIKMMIVNVIGLFKKRIFTNNMVTYQLDEMLYNKREYVKLRNFILIESDQYINNNNR